jgi:hypothetical protein
VHADVGCGTKIVIETCFCFQQTCFHVATAQSTSMYITQHSHHHCVATLSTGKRAGLGHGQRPKQALRLAAPVRRTLLTLLMCHPHVCLSWRQLPTRHLLADDLQTGLQGHMVHAAFRAVLQQSMICIVRHATSIGLSVCLDSHAVASLKCVTVRSCRRIMAPIACSTPSTPSSALFWQRYPGDPAQTTRPSQPPAAAAPHLPAAAHRSA